MYLVTKYAICCSINLSVRKLVFKCYRMAYEKHGVGSVVGMVTGYGLDGPGIESQWGVRFTTPIQTGPGAHPTSCTMDTKSFPGVKSGQGVMLTSHTLLVPWSRKSRAITLFPLWAIRPVQSLSVCTVVHFTFYLMRNMSIV